MIIWNPWHGCHKISEGCEHCYMYFLDGKRGIDTAKVSRTENFAMPLQRKRDGSFKYPSGMEMYVGLSTDFLWRKLMFGEKKPGESSGVVRIWYFVCSPSVRIASRNACQRTGELVMRMFFSR